ncbi:LOW QUALITY PROTEIN: complement decay-accelerating factor [Thomomys bottae]
MTAAGRCESPALGSTRPGHTAQTGPPTQVRAQTCSLGSLPPGRRPIPRRILHPSLAGSSPGRSGNPDSCGVGWGSPGPLPSQTSTDRPRRGKARGSRGRGPWTGDPETAAGTAPRPRPAPARADSGAATPEDARPGGDPSAPARPRPGAVQQWCVRTCHRAPAGRAALSRGPAASGQRPSEARRGPHFGDFLPPLPRSALLRPAGSSRAGSSRREPPRLGSGSALPSAGDCGLPAQIPHAQPTLGDLRRFPQGHTVMYRCDEGFQKVPGRPDSVVCLPSSQWSELEEFCNRSCKIPPRLNYAFLKKDYSKQNYFPIESTVEYECRPGYRRDFSQSETLTCLPSLEWSKPTEFCQKRSCPNPGDIQNGAIDIKTDILFGSSIFFSCKKGFNLVGASSSYCVLADNSVEWSDPLPVCEEIYCPKPPAIENGIILEESDTYTYTQTVRYDCIKGYVLVGNSSLYCDINDDDHGEWSSPPPQCREKSSPTQVPLTPQKPTMVKVLTTGAPQTHQKPTSEKVPGTEALPSPQKPTRVKVPTTDIPPSPQKPTKVDTPNPSAPPTAQKPTAGSVLPAEGPAAPQKPSTVHAPTPVDKPTAQKPTTGSVSDTEVTPAPQKPAKVDIPTLPPTPQKPAKVDTPTVPPTPQKPAKVDTPPVPPTPQKPTKVDTPTVPPTLQKPTKVDTPTVPPTLQKPITVTIPDINVPSTPQKPTKVDTPTVPPTPQKPTKVDTPTVPPTPQKPAKVDTPTVPPTLQKPITVTIPDINVPSTPQKPTKVDTPTFPRPQKPTKVDDPTPSVPPTPQQPTTVHNPTPSVLPTHQKLTTLNTSDIEGQPTPQKPIKVDDPTPPVSPTPQKATTVNISDAKVSSTAQNPTTSNNSATKVTAQTSLTPKALSTNAPLAGHNTNSTASATQTTPTTQRFATAKASFTQRPPATHKATTSQVPMTKSLQITQRLTSARITATHHAPGSRTTMGFHTTKTSKGTKMSTSGVANYLHVGGWDSVPDMLAHWLVFYQVNHTSEPKRTHMGHTDSFACDASNPWLADRKEEPRRKCTRRQRIFVVC